MPSQILDPQPALEKETSCSATFQTAVTNQFTPTERAFMQGYERQNLTHSTAVAATNDLLAHPSSNPCVTDALLKVMQDPLKYNLIVKEHNWLEQTVLGTQPITVHAPGQPRTAPAPGGATLG